MLNIINVKKSYQNVKALNDVSLRVARGQVVALLARNGAGKSSLISIIAGLLKADQGEVWIDKEKRVGKSLSQKKQQSIGLASQDTGIYPSLSVYKNFLFFCELYAIPRKYRQQRIKEVALLLGLDDLLTRRGNELSGGERRRLHTGCALLHQPTLLLLDEPTVGADPKARNDILSTVRKIAEQGTAVLYTSHYLPEIEQLNADIVVMEKGHVIEKGTQIELMQRYGEQYLTLDFNKNVAHIAASILPDSQCLSPTRIKVNGDNPSLSINAILNSLGALSNNICHFQQQSVSLEQTFLSIVDSQQISIAEH